VVIALAAIGAYVLLVGVASFIEVPVGRGLDALQLNALIRIGSAALVVRQGFFEQMTAPD